MCFETAQLTFVCVLRVGRIRAMASGCRTARSWGGSLSCQQNRLSQRRVLSPHTPIARWRAGGCSIDFQVAIAHADWLDEARRFRPRWQV
jgi:hypothetical protein